MNTRLPRNFGLWTIAITLFAASSSSVRSQVNPELEKKIAAIMARPEYAHSRFGMEFYSLDTHKIIFALNEQQFFVPGSTTKLLSEGTAMKLLGPDFRFKTKVYTAGVVDAQGTLKGDLVLVASGDPDLSGRLQPDGSLAFKDEDHSYAPMAGAAVVPGNPLAAIDDLATQVAAHGIHRIDGRVLVDISLFPEGEHEGGTGIVISPICVNDNVIDVLATGGAAVDTPAALTFSPMTRYARFTNKTKTVARGGPFALEFEDQSATDGTQDVIVTGTVPLDAANSLTVYHAPAPSIYAQTVFSEALAADGIVLTTSASASNVDFAALKPFYTEKNVVAVHTSAPLSEEVKVTLKVSQNLHASMTAPYLIGTYGAAPQGEVKTDPATTGFAAERSMLKDAGLDVGSAVQSDGAGAAAFFTPDFMVHYLTFLSQQSFAPQFRAALPVMGKDGTLVAIQKDSPAAGHVFAKTGTYGSLDLLNHELFITGKGLAGYIVTAKGQTLAFSAYLNLVPAPGNAADALTRAGNVLGEIAGAVYEYADPQ
jgi:D-alanyl-D-alanine carboxypeptidase/D-alanyl-D-alanine-endopeptidase (penicillin-binding protein 4)